MINSEGTPVVNGLSPGKRLSQGRLQLGLTQEQVAKELYITLVKIKALEADDYGRLNTDTFIRGYIRAYANLLKIDVVEVLAAYDQLLQERSLEVASQPGATAEMQAPGKPAQSVTPPSKGALQLLLVIAAFFLGMWLISVWFFDNQPDKNYTALAPVISVFSSSDESASSISAAQSSEPVDQIQALAPVLANSSSSQSAAATVSSTKARAVSSSSLLASASSQASVQSVITSSSAVASLSADAKPKSSALDTISFSFRAECWLEVSDSRGDVLATELQPAGSGLTLVGKAPFDVKLGNAPAVAIELNSKKIDVIPLLGSNVLTLRVSN